MGFLHERHNTPQHRFTEITWINAQKFILRGAQHIRLSTDRHGEIDVVATGTEAAHADGEGRHHIIPSCQTCIFAVPAEVINWSLIISVLSHSKIITSYGRRTCPTPAVGAAFHWM